ncbi:MAG TPA: HDIG domain-containing protein [Paludibacter sp.]|nr:HDIG domain-containing protein [Paludibacter sp.]
MNHILQIIEKYYPAGTEAHYIITKHSELVKNKVTQVANLHPELGIDLPFAQEAAMLHDIGIFRCHAPRIHCHGNHHYIEHGYLGADLLREEGLPRHALVAERHTGVGLSLELILKTALPLPHRDMQPVSIEEQVICYADKFYSKTHLHDEFPLERVRSSIRRFGDAEEAKFNDWHQLFG